MTKQISVFLDNKPGRVERVARILGQQGVNIRAAVIHDRGDFGIMRLLVNDPEKARLALVEAGFAAALQDILAIVVEDRPGGLYELLEVLALHDVNIRDGYGFVIQAGQEAIWCIQVDDESKTRMLIQSKGFRVLADSELYDL